MHDKFTSISWWVLTLGRESDYYTMIYSNVKAGHFRSEHWISFSTFWKLNDVTGIWEG